MKLNEVLDTSLLVGYHLLCNGADVYRVEQSIDYVCKAYGVEDIHAFAIPGSIVVTVSSKGESLTKTKRIVKRNINLDAVERLAAFSRYICTNKPEYPEVLERMEEISAAPVWGKGWLYGAHMLAGASFCLFFGGSFRDSLISALIGAFIMFMTRFMQRLDLSAFFITILCSFSAAFIGSKTGGLFPELFHSDKIVIGSIMLLVPGIALANSMRDFIASDTMSGLSRMAEALFVALGVAIGVAVAMYVV